MKAMKDRHGVPILTIVRFDFEGEPEGALHYVATDGCSTYELIMIVPEGSEINIVPNNAGYMELYGATVIVSGYESKNLNGSYITGQRVRVIYSHEYVNRTFAEAEADLLMNAGNIAG